MPCASLARKRGAQEEHHQGGESLLRPVQNFSNQANKSDESENQELNAGG